MKEDIKSFNFNDLNYIEYLNSVKKKLKIK